MTILSTADWSAAAWTNKQHVAKTLSKLGYSVLYIDGIGIRRPTAARQDMRRILKRVAKLLRPIREVDSHFHVISIPFLPWHASRVATAANRLLISLSVRIVQHLLGFSETTLWTYHPLTTLWFDLRRYRSVVYHCVDEVSAQPGMPIDLIKQRESDLTSRATYVSCTSPGLESKARRLNARTDFLPNVADFGHFNRALSLAEPEDINHIPKPRCGFIGAVSGYKIDFPLLASIAIRNPGWSFVLIGEVGLGEVGFSTGPLPPNIHLLGPRNYEELPSYCAGFAVGLLPYLLNEYTVNVFPMKLFEYLGAGLPVVSTDLPSLRDFTHLLRVAPNADAFERAIGAALEQPEEMRGLGLEAARSNTYESRTKLMLQRLDEFREVSTP